MTASTPSTLTSHLVSVVAEADPGLLAKMSEALARLDILPLRVYVKLHRDDDGIAEHGDASTAHLEIELYLSSQACDRKDRLVGLLRAMVGVDSVVLSYRRGMRSLRDPH